MAVPAAFILTVQLLSILHVLYASRKFKSSVSIDCIAQFLFKRTFPSVVWKFKQIETSRWRGESAHRITPPANAEKPAKHTTNRVTIILWRQKYEQISNKWHVPLNLMYKWDAISFLPSPPLPSPLKAFIFLTSSSLHSTQRTENGGSRCANPKSGGFEQLVTNYEEKKYEKKEYAVIATKQIFYLHLSNIMEETYSVLRDCYQSKMNAKCSNTLEAGSASFKFYC